MVSFKKDVVILENLPAVLTELDEIKAIANVEDPILSAEWSLINDYVDNQFVTTANVVGISRYESMLKLQVSDDDTLETRIMRVLARYQEQAPYTWIALNNILNALLGEGNYEVTRNVATKVLTVKLELTIVRQFDVLVDMLERITPQNMILNIELRYNQWSQVLPFTWGEINTKAWGQVYEEVL